MSQYPPTGPRRNIDDFDEDDDDTLVSGGDGGRNGGNDRQFTYYPEERYWTDYLRIAAPVLGVIILLGLAWFWLSHLIGGSGNGTANNQPTPTSASSVIVAGSPTKSGVTGTPVVVSTATSASTATTSPGGGQLASGGSAVVANTGGTGVNMRDAPTTGGNVVDTLPDGTALTITGDSVDADGYTWWPVKTSDGTEGYIVAEYLQPGS